MVCYGHLQLREGPLCDMQTRTATPKPLLCSEPAERPNRSQRSYLFFDPQTLHVFGTCSRTTLIPSTPRNPTQEPGLGPVCPSTPVCQNEFADHSSDHSRSSERPRSGSLPGSPYEGGAWQWHGRIGSCLCFLATCSIGSLGPHG